MADTNANTQNANQDAGTTTTGQNATGADNQTQNSVTNIDYDKIQSMIDKGTNQKESAILKSYFEQQGMTEDEVKEAVSKYKSDKANKAKEDLNNQEAMQKELETLRAEKVTNAINSKATDLCFDMGIDRKTIPYVLKMADLSKVTDDKGQISDEAVKTALQKVKDDCPQLFATNTDTNNQGFKVGADNSNTNTDADKKELRKLFGLKQ